MSEQIARVEHGKLVIVYMTAEGESLGGILGDILMTGVQLIMVDCEIVIPWTSIKYIAGMRDEERETYKKSIPGD